MSSHDVTLNGCIIAYSYDKLSKKCRACVNKDYCSEKSREKYGVLCTPLQQELAIKASNFSKISSAIATAGVTFEDATEAISHATKAIMQRAVLEDSKKCKEKR